MSELIEGLFLEECKGRFIGKVLVEGRTEECYISSTSRLEKYVELFNKPVLLEKTQGTNLRTRYKLYALQNQDNFIFLNLNESNQMLEGYLLSQGVKQEEIIREYTCGNGLKVDLKIGADYYIEVKAVLSDKRETIFPGERSRRFERQLELYKQLLEAGKRVELAIMLFNPQIQKVSLNLACSDICGKLSEALSMGMQLKVYKTWRTQEAVVVEEAEEMASMLAGQLGEYRGREKYSLAAAHFMESMNSYESLLEENYKKNNGIFYTDLVLATQMLKAVQKKKSAIIVDPCCGVGSFVMAARMSGYKNVYGMDQDEKAIEVCLNHSDAKLFAMDTLGISGEELRRQAHMPEKADLVIGNPPYAPLGDGVFLNTSEEFLSLVCNGGRNLFVAAIYRAFELVKEGGIISYIIPKNFLHVAGYSALRSFILRNKTILSITDLGKYFEKVRGEQIILTMKNEAPAEKAKIKLLQLSEGSFVKNTEIEQQFYRDEILLFRSYRDFRIYKKLISDYETLGTVCNCYLGRGRSAAEEAVKGKEIRKFGYKNLTDKTLTLPETGNKIFIQNIYSAEAGIIAAFGGDYQASQTVTVLVEKSEEACKYLLGILHSKLCNFYLLKYCYNNSKLTMHTDAKYLQKIPLVPYGRKGTGEIAEIAEELEQLEYLSPQWFDTVELLDRSVYRLYKLTEQEADFVTGQVQKIQSKRWIKDAERR